MTLAPCEIWEKHDHWRDSILSKISGYLDTNQTRNMAKCGRESIWRTCRGCSATKAFGYHCDLKFCPRCNHRITARRLAVLRLWTTRIHQPKHIVTTQRNFAVLTRSALRTHTKNLCRLRRQPVFAGVRGGCVSVEITNESRGWHLHAHWLVDANWVDAPELARTWGKLVGQNEGAIVRVKDCRDKAYLHEVSKYVVEGSQLASWKPNEIVEFLHGIKGLRFFFTFGTLFKCGPEIRRILKAQHHHRICECGCDKFVFRDEFSQTCHDIRTATRRR